MADLSVPQRLFSTDGMSRVLGNLLRQRAWLLLAVGPFLFATLAPVAHASSPAAPPIARGVVRIVNRLGKENSIGSGTLIEKKQDAGVVLTCAHLFSEGVGDLVVFFEGSTPRHALVIAIDKKNDLATLVVERPTAASIAVAKTLPPAGAPLASCGFGQEGRFHANHGRYLGQVTLEHGESSGVLELDGAARQGDSGGPIFDARHQVVAVILGSDGKVVDGTHCDVIRRFLATNPLTADLKTRLAQLARRPVEETILVFRPQAGEAWDAASQAPVALSTVRGVARYGSRGASRASIFLKGPATRVATLDEDGRFVFDAVPSGHYELTIDAVVHNRMRHAERSIWVAAEAGQQEVVLKLN
jgi:hypothetical protein